MKVWELIDALETIPSTAEIIVSIQDGGTIRKVVIREDLGYTKTQVLFT